MDFREGLNGLLCAHSPLTKFHSGAKSGGEANLDDRRACLPRVMLVELTEDYWIIKIFFPAF